MKPKSHHKKSLYVHKKLNYSYGKHVWSSKSSESKISHIVSPEFRLEFQPFVSGIRVRTVPKVEFNIWQTNAWDACFSHAPTPKAQQSEDLTLALACVVGVNLYLFSALKLVAPSASAYLFYT